MSGKPDKPNDDYVAGYKDGWSAGYADGKGAGYVDAKTRARMALEAACDALDMPRRQRDLLARASDNILGKVE